MIAQVFHPNAEFVRPTGTPNNETNTEIKTQPLTAKMKTKCSK